MTQGFFTVKQTQSITRPDGKVYSCASCGLYKNAKSPKMKPFGRFEKSILIIGTAPTEIEDRRNEYWLDKSGRLLKQTLADFGIDIERDCLCTNAVNCLPLDSNEELRNPTSFEISCCRRSLIKLVEEMQPKLILLAGNQAVEAMLGNRWKRDMGNIDKWYGWTIPDQDYKCWVCPIFHPKQIEASEKEALTVWRNNIEEVLKKLDEPLPKYSKPKIEIIEDLSVLRSIQSDTIAFDYETTGIKPHAPGHRVICASVADSEDHVFVFMMPPTKKERQPFLDLLANPMVNKMAHNMKYEDTWSREKLKQQVKGWLWDSMIAAHILDNRPGVTGLKFQTYVNFGVVDYSSEVDPYLQSTSKDGNAINKIQDLYNVSGGMEKLMHYCALDSIYQYRLATLQMERIGYDTLPF